MIAMTLRERLFKNPYLYSGTVVAKACTLLGTLVWSFVVLAYPRALSFNPNYEHMLRIVGSEDAWAMFYAAIAIPLAWRLFRCAPPRWPGVIGYAVLALLWAHLWWGTVINGQPWPAGTAATTVMMTLSLYGFISNPRDACQDCIPRANGECPLTRKPCANARRYDESHHSGV